MRINHNINALNTFNQVTKNTNAMGKSLEKLSSGLRINKASDDAAGLAISEKMRSQIRGLDAASRNAQDGVSMIQTAEGGMSQTHDILQRMKELGVQASSETYDPQDLEHIQTEVNELLEEMDNIAGKSEFNGQKLLDGTADMDLAVGAKGESLNVTIASMKTADLGTATVDDGMGGTTTSGTALDTFKTGGANALADRASAQKFVEAVDNAINSVSSERSKIGAKQNRLEYTINNLSTTSENLTAAESRIRDVDMAKEMMEMTKNQVLSQAAQSMLSQANQQPQSVLNILR